MKQWNAIFKNKGVYFFKPQEDILKISKLFKKSGTRKILDLGCGSGRHIVYLAKYGFDIYGIDIASTGIKITKECLKKENLKANLKIGNIYKKLVYPNNFFDALISTQTINHNNINNIRKLIKEIKRVLKPNGFIFVTVNKKITKQGLTMNKKINKLSWNRKLKYLDSRTAVPLDGDEKGLLHYFFNKGILRKEFSDFKCDIWTDSKNKNYCLLGRLIK